MRGGARVFENERVVQMVKFWTVRQEELIREYGHLGAEAVADATLAECGVRRTVRAVQQHAHVIHASLRVKPTCPECGAVGVPLNYQSGLCPTCHDRMRLAEAIAYKSEYKRSLLVTIRNAAMSRAQYWTAAAWLLERKYPMEFGRMERKSDEGKDEPVQLTLGLELEVMTDDDDGGNTAASDGTGADGGYQG